MRPIAPQPASKYEEVFNAASLARHLFRIIPDPYLEERAARATGEGFSHVLSQVPDVPPDDYDRL
ncbi:hypothetical protein QUF72_05240 [Desulfobacterales bacterium HSG2]|nr:hypothetical protein [Desulfobacterales bacterium HSG2]